MLVLQQSLKVVGSTTFSYCYYAVQNSPKLYFHVVTFSFQYFVKRRLGNIFGKLTAPNFVVPDKRLPDYTVQILPLDRKI